MKLKRTDLELLMQYLEKEKPEAVSVHIGDERFQSGVTFVFEDLERRTCSIKLYDATHNVTPDLTKTMKLYSRLQKGKTSETEEATKEKP